jgi:uncharacterized membrane protein YhaH (DUF805 family)
MTEQRLFLGRPEAAMDTKWLLSGFESRTSRARYWLAVLIILASMISALLLLSFILEKFGIAADPLSIDLVGISASVEGDDTAAKMSLIPQLVVIAMTLVFAWFYLAASIRRLHDRNRSGWWIIPFIGATGPFEVFGHRLAGSWATFPVKLAVLTFFIWGIVEMYGLRGTNGPNRFGSAPSAPADPIDTRPPWDQQSELEFVPHQAGPPAGATGVPGNT